MPYPEMPMRRALFASLLLAGCSQDVGLTESSVCDGELQRDETTVDSPFDGDGDGFFDATNPGCIATYAAEDLDCDDTNADVHPGAAEAVCNGLDDDCDEATIDHQDEDDDGADSCSDCDDRDPDRRPQNTETVCNGIDDDCDETTIDEADADDDNVSTCEDDCDDDEPTVFPGADEICDDNLDNDCDGQKDEQCDVDYSGTYTAAPQPAYSCAYGYVKIGFESFVVTHFDPNITFAPNRGSQPPTMAGTVSGASFYASKTLPGSCTEDYELIGSFTTETEFTATFNVKFSGGSGACFDCKNQTWTVTGTK